MVAADWSHCFRAFRQVRIGIAFSAQNVIKAELNAPMQRKIASSEAFLRHMILQPSLFTLDISIVVKGTLLGEQ
jgi:hypothetical protein